MYERPRALLESDPDEVRPEPDASRTPLRMADRGRLLQNGCELWLYQETKGGNMDCTFCLECVHACPHDNVGISVLIAYPMIILSRRRWIIFVLIPMPWH